MPETNINLLSENIKEIVENFLTFFPNMKCDILKRAYNSMHLANREFSCFPFMIV